MEPTTAEDWKAVAHVRGQDAASMHEASRQLAALYMYGYVAESLVKAMVVADRGKVEKLHDLVRLLDVLNIKVDDLPNAATRAFVEGRDVQMRYWQDLPATMDYTSARDAAVQVASWLSRRLNRRRKGSRS